MRIWGYTPNVQQIVTADTIQAQAIDIENSLAMYEGSMLANNLLWICASTESILANLASGNMVDAVGKMMDQGAAFEDLVYLEANIQAMIKTVHAALQAGIIRGCQQDRFVQLNGQWHCLHDCLGAIIRTTQKMNKFLFPLKQLIFPIR